MQNITNELLEPMKRLSQSIKSGNLHDAKNDISKFNGLLENLDLMHSLEQRIQQRNTVSKFNIKFLTNKVLFDCESILKQKNIIIQLDIDSTILVGNRYNIYHVIKNLLLTAIDYAKCDNFICITTKTKNDNLCQFELQVLGISISESALNIMFEPVNLVEEISTTITFTSLYVVRLIMEKHHQKYGVYNNTQGFIFYFNLELPASNIINH